MTNSFTNQSVELTGLQSKAPALITQVLWSDGSGTSFYANSGGINFAGNPDDLPDKPSNELWKFTPSDNQGTWDLIGPKSTGNFTNLVRNYNGIYVSGAGLGFSLGGVENSATNDTIFDDDFIATPGVVMFNTSAESQERYNVSSTGYSQTGVAINGAGHFVPSFGPNGLLVVLGGYIDDQETLAGFDFVSMFEPTLQQWATQAASGSKPTPLHNPCVVGAQGDNGTYEVDGKLP